MKKFISMLFACLFCAVLLHGVPVNAQAEEKKLSVVSTIFPFYDFVRQIAGDHVELTMLLPPGTESHSFEPKPQDIIAIQKADVFLYVGGETDKWVARILESMDTSGITIMSALSMVEAVEEEIVPGMEDDHEHGEIDPEHVAERPLTNWDGAWASIAPLLDTGTLGEYVAHLAEDGGITEDEAIANQAKKWRSELGAFALDNGTLRIEGVGEALYDAAGYKVIESDHGVSVWYQYEITEPVDGLPGYLMINDHGAEDKAITESEETAHFHLKYGDEGFDALYAAENWSPMFFAADAEGDAIQDALLGHGHSHEEAAELDEHVWTSPKNAQIIVTQIAETLAEMDSANAETYRANAAAYNEELAELDAAFQLAVDEGVRKTIVFGDRFPFRYLADAYGLTYYAAFPGCATETEASASTIKFLIDTVRQENIPAVFHIELSNEKIADALCESTGAKKLAMHSCHNVTRDDFAKGVGYLELMWRNAESLREALQ